MRPELPEWKCVTLWAWQVQHSQHLFWLLVPTVKFFQLLLNFLPLCDGQSGSVCAVASVQGWGDRKLCCFTLAPENGSLSSMELPVGNC